MNGQPDFLILGPVEVVSMGCWYGGLPPTTRKLLALLLSAGREGVTVPRIVTSLWGEDYPASARQMVRAHVMRLRAMLEPSGRAVVHHPYLGYRLETEDGDIDATVFEELLRQGRGLMLAGRFDAAADCLERAVGLWRGHHALADVRDVLDLQAEAVRLEELRLLSEELLADCQLMEGRVEDLVPRLAALRVRYPLREKFLAQFMVALSGTGRQVEAMTAYLGSREVFIERSGLEPSARLTTVHGALLRGDPWQSVVPLISLGGGPVGHRA
ncbi:BTAD domain-containing putative transcriptional regulator [Streptomyces sp. NPDC048604]|uniref:AfsR/SARP family transcriptional regulator n=1 Tax=Streptomyces sp. NPDC048604 TaxID=3365578 RepID=UPI003716CF61